MERMCEKILNKRNTLLTSISKNTVNHRYTKPWEISWNSSVSIYLELVATFYDGGHRRRII